MFQLTDRFVTGVLDAYEPKGNKWQICGKGIVGGKKVKKGDVLVVELCEISSKFSVRMQRILKCGVCDLKATMNWSSKVRINKNEEFTLKFWVSWVGLLNMDQCIATGELRIEEISDINDVLPM
ncbi:hypothetical protein CLIB1423_32S00870 [[Candida] railenensis]|uniref:Uncharacterized protein n=1 Tax=[Candida] railenensis TaxID=45579 RepID=A0A9P0W037_9ASCO|nr:hypothetical protein CLIB1423_32S00870 [[Candida] railenensis]